MITEVETKPIWKTRDELVRAIRNLANALERDDHGNLLEDSFQYDVSSFTVTFKRGSENIYDLLDSRIRCKVKGQDSEIQLRTFGIIP